MNKNARKYYKSIYRMFPEHTTEEKEYLYKLQKYIERYDQLHPETTYEYYLERFGEPQDIVSSYYARVDNTLIIEKMKIKKVVKITCIILLISFILFMLWISYTRYTAYQRSIENYYFEETTVVD